MRGGGPAFSRRGPLCAQKRQTKLRPCAIIHAHFLFNRKPWLQTGSYVIGDGRRESAGAHTGIRSATATEAGIKRSKRPKRNACCASVERAARMGGSDFDVERCERDGWMDGWMVNGERFGFFSALAKDIHSVIPFVWSYFFGPWWLVLSLMMGYR